MTDVLARRRAARPTRLTRRLAGTAVAGAVAAGAVLGPVTTGPVAAAPAGTAQRADECPQPFPIADLARGDAVTGSTVTAGTTPEGFTGEVLGTIEDGIAPGLDMVMAELDMPEFESTDGIWQGMSGSPVYAADGRLIGAVAYGLSFGPTRIAGITPYAAMLEDAAGDVAPGTPQAAGRVAVDRGTAAMLADRADISRQSAEQGFAELRMPVGVAGVSLRRFTQVHDRERTSRLSPRASYVLGRAGERAAGPETIVPGGNLAASLSYGDVTMAGVGTVTSVCDGHVLAFGHPLIQAGRTQLGLHPADAVYIQPDSLGAPFKVANVGDVAGTVVGDRLTGLSAYAGPSPASIALSSTTRLTGGDAEARESETQVLLPLVLGEVTFYQLLASLDRVAPDLEGGTAVQTITATGTEKGEPFRIRLRERMTSSDVYFESAFTPAMLAETLVRLRGATIETMHVETTLSRSTATSRVAAVERRVQGRWVRVGRRAPATVREGGTLRLRVRLAGADAGRTLRVAPIAVPPRAGGSIGLVRVDGGTRTSGWFGADTLAGLREQLRDYVANDEVRVIVSTEGGGRFGFEGIFTDGTGFRGDGTGPDRPRHVRFTRTRVMGPVAHVVRGSLAFPFVVRPVRNPRD